MCERKLMIGPFYGILCLDDDEPSGSIKQLYLNFWSVLSSKVYLEIWCFSDRASWIDYTLITNFDALIIIYS